MHHLCNRMVIVGISLMIGVASISCCRRGPTCRRQHPVVEQQPISSLAQSGKTERDPCCEYFEDFSSLPTDCESDRCAVNWCDGVDTTKSQVCSPPRALRIQPSQSSSSGQALRVWFGDLNVSKIRVELRYSQWEGNPPVPDLASSWLEVNFVSTDDFDSQRCPNSGYKQILQLNRTWSVSKPECYHECVEVEPEDHHRALYIRFRKRGSASTTPILLIDDLRVEVIEEADPE